MMSSFLIAGTLVSAPNAYLLSHAGAQPTLLMPGMLGSACGVSFNPNQCAKSSEEPRFQAAAVGPFSAGYKKYAKTTILIRWMKANFCRILTIIVTI